MAPEAEPIAAYLILRLIIQTIRQDPSGSVWSGEASNLSRPDPSGTDQTDAEHQATELALRCGSYQTPSGAA
jgi:hypothetical protein